MTKLNRKYITFITFLLIAFATNAQTLVQAKIKRVVIDAGHGGKDPGAIGTFSKEKDIVLSIALKLGEKIQQLNPDVKIIYTRETDEFIELYQRANIANKAKADLFLSIHANSSTNKAPNGLEFFVLGPHKNESNLEVAKRENSVVSLEGNVTENYGFDPNSPEGTILMTMKQSLYMDNSIQLAKKMEAAFEADPNQAMRGVKQAGFLVLHQTAMPSCLIEVGFISNVKEEEYIASEIGQNTIASKLAEAFTQYKNNYEKNTTSQPTQTTKPEPKAVEKKNEKDPELSKVISNQGSMYTQTVIMKTAEEAAKKPSSAIAIESIPRKTMIIKDNENEDLFSAPIQRVVADKIKNQPVNEDKIPSNYTIKEILRNGPVLTTQTQQQLEKKFEESLKPSPEPNMVPSRIPNQSSDMIAEAPKAFESENPKTKSTSEIQEKKTTTRSPLADPPIPKIPAKPVYPSEAKNIKVSQVDPTKSNPEQFKPKTTPTQTPTPKSDEITDPLNSRIIKGGVKPVQVEPSAIQPQKPSKPVIATNSVAKSDIVQQANQYIENKPQKNQAKTDPITPKPENDGNYIYYIQIAAYGIQAPENHKIFQDFTNVVESNEDGMYKYLVGKSKTPEDAAKVKEGVIAKGYTGAFTVKYKNGVRVK